MPSPIKQATDWIAKAPPGTPEFHAKGAVRAYLKAAAEDEQLVFRLARAAFPLDPVHLDQEARINVALHALAEEVES